jgi:serine/threonine-protein kinase PpkA
MRLKNLLCLLLALLLLAPAAALAQEKRRPVKIEGMKVLPLRVLTRPFSNIYSEPNESSPTVQENLPAFQPFYVYTQPGLEMRAGEMGWYEVGSDVRGKVLGWMKTKDVFEWHQTMCLAYTHPDGRKPVLMFAGKDPLLNLINQGGEERGAKVQELYDAIEQGNITPQFPVKSVEPKKAVDIGKQFYLLPILNHEVIEVDGREGRLLRLAAVTASGPKARESSDIRKNTEYLEESQESATQAPEEVIKKLSVDVVFVVDTTVSMKPYIKATLDVVREVAQGLAQNPEVEKSVRLGIWGYRDSVKDIPGIGYTTKNYTPELQGIEQFQETLSQVKVTKVDSKDWAEDVFSGISEAMANTQWTENAIRIVVLMGDAAGHPAGHPRNLSGHTPETLRAIADDSSVYLFAVHIKPERAVKYQAPAEEHFRALSENPGIDESSYVGVMSSDMEGFSNATRQLTDAVVRLVSLAKGGGSSTSAGTQEGGSVSPQDDPFADEPIATEGTEAAGTQGAETIESEASTGGETAEAGAVEPGKTDDPFADEPVPAEGTEAAGTESAGSGEASVSDEPAPAEGTEIAAQTEKTQTEGGEMAGLEPEAGEAQDPVRAKANQVVRAALVRWIGSQTKAMPPRDIVAWVVDKDLINPAVSSLEVRLLVNKRQLDSMRTVLNEVMAAGVRGQLGGEDFFSALQATSAVAARDPDRIKNARSMAQTGLIPEFLMNLPYRSRLMEMSNDLWASWSADEQDEFINELKAKIEAYEDIHDKPDGWVELNQGDDPGEHVYPVSLELLP